jgi:phage FluMu protein gp41
MAETLNIAPLPSDIVIEMDRAIDAADHLTITDDESYYAASQMLQCINDQRRAVEKHYASIKKPLNAARKHIIELEKADVGRLTQPASALSAAIVTYEDTQRDADAAEAKTLLAASLQGVTVAPQVPRLATADRQYRRQTRSVEVVNLEELVHAVARGEVPLEAVAANTTILNRMAREQGDLFRVAGCQVNINTTVVTR